MDRAWIHDVEFKYPMGGVFPLWSIGERVNARRAMGGVLLSLASAKLAAAVLGSGLTRAEWSAVSGDAIGDATKPQTWRFDINAGHAMPLKGDVGLRLARLSRVARVGRRVLAGSAFLAGDAGDSLSLMPAVPAGGDEGLIDYVGVQDGSWVGNIVQGALNLHGWYEEVWGWPMAFWLRSMAEGHFHAEPPPLVLDVVAALAAIDPTVEEAVEEKRDEEAAAAEPRALVARAL